MPPPEERYRHSFREDEFAEFGDAEPIGLVIVLNVQLSLTLEERA